MLRSSIAPLVLYAVTLSRLTTTLKRLILKWLKVNTWTFLILYDIDVVVDAVVMLVYSSFLASAVFWGIMAVTLPEISLS